MPIIQPKAYFAHAGKKGLCMSQTQSILYNRFCIRLTIRVVVAGVNHG